MEKGEMVCGRMFYLQWHITDNCSNNCRHCYNRDKRTDKETTREDFIAILNDIINICERWGRSAQITLIGGDPLLHPEFCDFVDILATTPRVRIIIAGNPETLTTSMIDWLQPKIFAFQVSVDGNKETHDWFRYSGSYEIALNCIKEASDKGLRMHVMTTVSKENVGQLVDVMHAVYGVGAHRWAFARYVPPIGQTLDLDPKEFQKALFAVEQAHLPYEEKGHDRQRKDPLWFPFRNVNHLPKLEDNPRRCQIDGCGIGSPTLGILPDNTVMACRRHEGSVLGKWEKKGDILELFLYSPVMEKLRAVEKINKCNRCPFLYYCRGCRAIAYAVRGNYTDPDPTCPF